ncbi:RNA polymerase sigma factor [Acetobacter sp. TBRC 12305]|uniref:RNA polymerase sigma factor n=1 Tax=Acetobacter garciniae TaxID=2817435 RepID=A0A939KQC4_9PROT|nr:RNA polymerase sigma factor [Acetobacter garciniae]MBO1325152.1 RNA polymerase sigma factor [Acetobacter garciniae]MBX0344877.1 RNA polymerase sigma factor [Acetobacter garciniae]
MTRQRDWRRLLRKVRGATRDDEADDHLQNALVSYLERPADTVRNPESYVTRSAINSIINTFRRQQRVQFVSVHETGVETSVPDQGPTPEAAYTTVQRLQKYCERLPPRTRTIFLLHRSGHLTYREIAARAGVSESAVEKHIAKALVLLRNWMDE